MKSLPDTLSNAQVAWLVALESAGIPAGVTKIRGRKEWEEKQKKSTRGKGKDKEEQTKKQ